VLARPFCAAALAAACAVTLAPPLCGQNAPGQGLAVAHDAAFGPGSLFVVDATNSRLTAVVGLPPALTRPYAVADDPFRDEVFYVGTDGRTPQGILATDVFSVQLRGGQVVATTRLNAAPLAEETIVDLTVIGDRLLVLGRRSLFYLPLAGGAQQVVAPLPPPLEGRAMASDGRHVFVAVNNREILRIDLFDPANLSLFARIPGGFINAILDLHVSRESLFVGTGDPLLGGELLQYRLRDGVRLFRINSGFAAVSAVSGDEQLGALVLAGRNAGTDSVRTFQAGVLGATFGAVSQSLVNLSINRAPRVLRYGQPCPDSSGLEPRIRSNSSPSPGNTGFRMLLDTQPNRVAALLAADRTNPLATPPSTGLRPYGAPGCFLHLLPTASALVVVPASGTGSFPLPIPSGPSVLGFVMDCQWVVFDPAANPLGIVSTQGAAIVVGS